MPLFNSQLQLQDKDLDDLKAKAKLFQDSGIAPQLNFGGQAGPQVTPQMPQQIPVPQQASQNNNADQASIVQETPTKSFNPSLKQRLFGYSDSDLLPANSPKLQDEYGLQKPSKEHAGILSTIAKYALPALTGVAGGVGILPGLAATYAGSERQDLQQEGLNQANYNTARTQALASKRQATLDSQGNRKLDLEAAKTPAEIAKAQADTAKALAEAGKANERPWYEPLKGAVSSVFGHPQAGKVGAVSQKQQPSSSGTPQGATHVAPGSDGNNYYVDSKGNILGKAK